MINIKNSWNSQYFKVWQLLTHMFLHSGWVHLAFNMIALWLLGRLLEKAWGGKRLLIFYLVCGVGAAIISLFVDHTIFNQFSNATVGASGAIYGLLVALAIKFPNIKIIFIFLPIPLAAKYFVPLLLLIDLTAGSMGISLFGQNIAHFAHIGGALTGFILTHIYQRLD